MSSKPAWVFWAPLLLLLAIVFYPLIWGMVPSANDVFLNYDPWRGGSFERFAANPTLNDPATGYWTKAALLRNEPASLLWDPYLAGGVPGHLDLLSGLWSPFALLPTLVSLRGWYALMLLLKALAACGGMYLLLRRWGLGPAAGATAGLAWAFCGQNLALLFWPHTNATVLLPWLLLLPSVAERRWFFALAAAVCLGLLGAGWPVFCFYAAYLFVLYLAAVERRAAWGFLKRFALPAACSLLIVAPFLVLAAKDLRAFRFLETRAGAASVEPALPWRHLALYLDPHAYGPPQGYAGVPVFPTPDSYHASAAYLGVPPLLLAVLGLLAWRDRRARFFAAAGAVLLFLLYVPSPLRTFVGHWPGISTSSFHRLSLLLAFSLCVLAGFGLERLARVLPRPSWAALVPLVLAADLGFAAAAFLPYQKWADVLPARTPGLAFLEEKLAGTPYRVAGLYDALWPNSAEWTRLPDVRAHFAAEGWYRDAFAAVDPDASKRMGTFLLLWDARIVHSPLLTGLFVRYLAEPPFIRTVENEIEARTVREAVSRWAALPPNGLRRGLHPAGTPYRLGFSLRAPAPAAVEVVLREDFTRADLRRLRLEVPAGETTVWAELEAPWELAFVPLEVEVVPSQSGMEVGMRDPFEFAATVGMSPLRPVYAGPDLTVFENREADRPALLRFHAADALPPNPERLRVQAAVAPEHFERVRNGLLSDARDRRGTVRLDLLTRTRAALEAETSAPALLVLPFKYNPLWAEVEVDGAPAVPVRANGAMTGVLLEKGRHRVEIAYGRRFLPWAAASALCLLLTAVWAAWRWSAPPEPTAR
jgi:hypothetical protein